MQIETESRITVVNSKRMTDEQFVKHWNYRHRETDTPQHLVPLGQGPSDSRKIITLYRAFHDTAHRLEVGEKYDHAHNPS